MTDQGIGASPARVGGVDRVTGHQAYVADIRLEDALHVKLVSLDVARARIIAIDTSAALAVPGVRLAITAAGPARSRCPASDRSSRIGRSSRSARPSTTASRSRRSPRRPSTPPRKRPASSGSSTRSCRRSSRSPAPSTRPRRSSRTRRSGPAIRSPPRTSSASTTTAGATSTPTAADVVVEGTYTFPMVTQFAIEPHAFIAAPDGDGIAIWSSIQHPNWLQRVIAGLLHLPLSKVRVFAPDPGGGFGGKQHAKYEPLVAFMALRAGPAGPPRPDARGDVPGRPPGRLARSTSAPASARTARLVFRDIEANYLIGAYADIADRTVGKGSYTSLRAVPGPGRPDRRPEHPVAHDALDRVPRLRQPAADLGGRIEHERGGAGRSASIRSSSGSGTSPAAARPSSRATRRPTGTGPRPSSERPS